MKVGIYYQPNKGPWTLFKENNEKNYPVFVKYGFAYKKGVKKKEADKTARELNRLGLEVVVGCILVDPANQVIEGYAPIFTKRKIPKNQVN